MRANQRVERLRAGFTVNWPSHVTIVQPAHFSKVANEIASLFALASTRLHQIRVHGR